MNLSAEPAEDTIAAPITAPGRAAVSLLRVSGSRTREVLKRLLKRAERVLDSPKMLVFSEVEDLCSQSEDAAQVLDRCLVSFFPKPHSYTGEDTAEFNIHGSPYLLSRLLQSLQKCGVRSARPGEFTERAFLNGQMDLSQAEAVADVINAETEIQARVAREQLDGRLSQSISDLGEPLRDLLAEIEAHIDFPEEEIESESLDSWVASLETQSEVFERYLQSFSTGRLYREGASVVLAGMPNVGKSSLMNSLLGEERAIVTAIPGTTRDSIEERVSLDGLYVRFWDTAGLVADSGENESRGDERVLDQAERMGIERSWKQVKSADLVVYLLDAASSLEGQEALFRRVEEQASNVVLVLNKVDLLSPPEASEILGRVEAIFGRKAQGISVTEGIGLDQLSLDIRQALLSASSTHSPVLITTQRHFEQLSLGREAVERALCEMKRGAPTEIVSLEIRGALDALSEIIGATCNEDILGRIFSKFCIGK